MINGLNHITISVRDLERSFSFYMRTLGLKPLMKHDRGAYLLAGDLWFCLSLDEQTRSEPLAEYTHFAFSVEQKDFAALSERIQNSGAKVWKENKSEGDSLYFLDPDGHKLEIHVGSWRSRLEAYRQSPKSKHMTFFTE
jgi:catechol 2,3-dioxygenase-like lactoylglutathione lyase family enzyme